MTSAKESAPPGKVRLVIGASAGGHTNELLLLMKAAGDSWPLQAAAAVTTMDISAPALARYSNSVHVIGEANRFSPLSAIAMLIRSLRVARLTRPHIVLTTGSLPLAVFSIACHFLYSSRIIWIDSIAQMSRPSLSGRLVSYFSDSCFTQWPEVAEQYKRFKYKGELL